MTKKKQKKTKKKKSQNKKTDLQITYMFVDGTQTPYIVSA